MRAPVYLVLTHPLCGDQSTDRTNETAEFFISSAEVIILAMPSVRLNTEAQPQSSPSVKPRTCGVFISSAGLNLQQLPPWETDYHLGGPDGFPNPLPILNRKRVPARILGGFFTK